MDVPSNDFILRLLEKLDDKLDRLAEKNAETGATLELHRESEEANTVFIRESLATQSIQLAEYNQQLKEHMRRTDLLERRINPLEKDLEVRKAAAASTMNKLKKWSFGAAILSGLVGAVWVFIQIAVAFKWF